MIPGTLKVLVVDQGRGIWGAQRYLLRLAPLLRDLGIELTLAGPSSLELHTAWNDSGFATVDLDLPLDRSIRGADGTPTFALAARAAGDVPRVARRLAAVITAGRYDAVWANSHWTHLEASIAGRLAKVPTMLHLHEEALPGLGTWLRAAAIAMAWRTVAVSEAVAAGLPAMVATRVDVVPNGVDTEALTPAGERHAKTSSTVRADLGVADDDVMLLAATRIDPCKRIEDLVTSVVALDDPRVRLVIAGTTSEYPDYQREVIADARRRAGDQVVFCGIRDDMLDLYRASDVLIHAGMVEGMPLGVIEAQACALPVVAYAVAGVPEVVRDGISGALARPGDVADLTRALRVVVADRQLRTRMGAAARANANVRHDIRSQAHRNAELLHAACGRHVELVSK